MDVMELTDKERDKLCLALVSALPDIEAIDMFTLKFNVDRNTITSAGGTPWMITKIIRWFESRGHTDRLIAKTLNLHPDNARVRKDLPEILDSLTQRKQGNISPGSPQPADARDISESPASIESLLLRLENIERLLADKRHQDTQGPPPAGDKKEISVRTSRRGPRSKTETRSEEFIVHVAGRQRKSKSSKKRGNGSSSSGKISHSQGYLPAKDQAQPAQKGKEESAHLKTSRDSKDTPYDLVTFRKDLLARARSFDKAGVALLCQQLIDWLYQNSDQYPDQELKMVLRILRSKRYFDLMGKVAEVMIQTGRATLEVRRFYAQSLIDQGQLSVAMIVLQDLMAQTSGNPMMEAEIRGLIGRGYKQLYLNAGDQTNTHNQAILRRAVQAYYEVYTFNPKNLWHGINVVALLSRAKRDGIVLDGFPDEQEIAKAILEEIETIDADGGGAVWDFATAAEASIALNQPARVVYWIQRYLKADYLDAFELVSTLRQLEEVWQLDMTSELGQLILPTLRAELLKREGGALELSVQDLRPENQEQSLYKNDYEKVFDGYTFQTYEWYRLAQERCRAVARIERANSQSFGTGFLIKGSELSSKLSDELVLLTNAHVISEDPQVVENYDALPPQQAVIMFEALGNKKHKVARVLWTSPPHELDATILSLKSLPPQIEPLPLDLSPVRMSIPPPRMCLIGHPSGGELQISMQDTHLLAANDRVIHYRTPVEAGSSGCPVFEAVGWKVVALHHAENSNLKRIDGSPGKYVANEGISMRAIHQAIESA